MIAGDRVRIFFDLLKPLHKPPPLWVIYPLLLIVFVVILLRVAIVPYIHLPGSVT
jgi:hypothetical protein